MAILISFIALVVAIFSLLVGYFFSFLSFYDGFLNQVYSCEKDFKNFKRAFYNFQTKANEYYERTGESLLGNDEVGNLKAIIKEMEVSLEKTKKDFEPEAWSQFNPILIMKNIKSKNVNFHLMTELKKSQNDLDRLLGEVNKRLY